MFNNIAIAARHAQEKYGLERILVIDWDVHHANGTQSSFYFDPGVCVISMHREWPFYPPDSGFSNELGDGNGRGFNINIPLPPGTGDRGYLLAWDNLVEPISREFAPQLILVSAGYDAHVQDPLGGQQVSTRGFFELSRRLANIAESICSPAVFFLEGGYNSVALSESVLATLNAICFSTKAALDSTVYDMSPSSDRMPDAVDKRIARLSKNFRHYWTALE